MRARSSSSTRSSPSKGSGSSGSATAEQLSGARRSLERKNWGDDGSARPGVGRGTRRGGQRDDACPGNRGHPRNARPAHLDAASAERAREHPRRDRRKGSSSDRRDPREALGLVGDALAATHNPRVLLPVILEVITESTGARGGQIVTSGREVAWIGTVGGSDAPTLSLPLGYTGDGDTTLLLHSGDKGF